MSSDSPLVSIVIPTFNRENTLPRAIKSSLNQTYDNIEIIVVDDGSTDDTGKIIEKYKNHIEYIIFDENKGANVARNEGIKKASGELISFLDSDDEYPQNNIKAKVEVLNTLPTSCAGVFTPYKQYKGNRLWRTSKCKKDVVDIDVLKQANVIGGFSCICIRKSIFNEIGYLDESLPSSQDYDFYLRVTRKYSLMQVSDTYVKRYSGKNRIGFDSQRKLEGHKKILEKHSDILSEKRKARQYSSLGIILGRNKMSAEASKNFRKSVLEYPYEVRSYPLYIMAQFGDNSLYYTIRILDSIMSLQTHIRARFM